MNGIPNVPTPRNEAVVSYAPGTPARARLKSALTTLASTVTEIPLWIDGRAVEGPTTDVVMPHDHQRVVGRAAGAHPRQVQAAIDAAERARPEWAALPQADRCAVFLKAADLLTGPYRDRINAATMLGQSKTCHQAEIEAACELADFWRFNAAYADALMRDQPISPPGLWNQTELRPLDGFVFAVTPFNFTAIAANLPTAPALMGNTAIWKPGPHPDALRSDHGRDPRSGGLAAGGREHGRRRAGGDRRDGPGRSSARRPALHRVDGDVPKAVDDGRTEHRALPTVSAHRRRDRRQRLHLCPPQRRPAGSRDGDHSRGIRVPGPKVQRGLPDLRAPIDLAGAEGPSGGGDRDHQDRRHPGLLELHGRGHRCRGVPQDHGIRRSRQHRRGLLGHRRRHLQRGDAGTSSIRPWSRPVGPTTV